MSWLIGVIIYLIFILFILFHIRKGNKMVDETKIAETCFSHFFKYEKNYNETMKALVVEKNDAGHDYYKMEEKVKKNSSLFI